MTTNAVNSAEDQARRLEGVAGQVTTMIRRPEAAVRIDAASLGDDWSPMEILGHLVEMIPYWLSHCKTIIAATGNPPNFGRTLDAPERIAGVAMGARGNAEEVLQAFDDEVKAAAATIRHMSPEERAKTGVHNRDGLMTVAQIIERFIVSHAEDHCTQMRAALDI